MKKRLGDLRLGEPFTSRLSGLEGVVLDWGHTRASRHIKPRQKLRAVLVAFGERELLMSPDAVVDVESDRINWTAGERPDGRWVKYLGAE